MLLCRLVGDLPLTQPAHGSLSFWPVDAPIPGVVPLHPSTTNQSESAGASSTFSYWHSPERACWRVILQNSQVKARNVLSSNSFAMADDMAIYNIIIQEYDAYVAKYPAGPEAGKYFVLYVDF
jgi:hypothetical protein